MDTKAGAATQIKAIEELSAFSDVKTGGAAYLLDVSEEFYAGDCQSWRAHRTEGCIGTKETACSTVKATGESGNSGYPCLTENGG